MQIKLSQSGKVTVVKVVGRLDIEKTPTFKKVFAEKFAKNQVVFVLDELSFVGSTGIQTFFRGIEEMSEVNFIDSRVVGLNQDFRKFIELSGPHKLQICENITHALSDLLNPAPKPVATAVLLTLTEFEEATDEVGETTDVMSIAEVKIV